MAHETTPLLTQRRTGGGEQQSGSPAAKRKAFFDAKARVYLVTLVLGTSFLITATTLIYSFRVFNCDEYYESHPDAPSVPDGADRCAIHAVDAA